MQAGASPSERELAAGPAADAGAEAAAYEAGPRPTASAL